MTTPVEGEEGQEAGEDEPAEQIEGEGPEQTEEEAPEAEPSKAVSVPRGYDCGADDKFDGDALHPTLSSATFSRVGTASSGSRARTQVGRVGTS